MWVTRLATDKSELFKLKVLGLHGEPWADCINGIVVSCLSYYWLTPGVQIFFFQGELQLCKRLVEDLSVVTDVASLEIEMQIEVYLVRGRRFLRSPGGSGIHWYSGEGFLYQVCEFLFCCITTALVGASEQSKSCMNSRGNKIFKREEIFSNWCENCYKVHDTYDRKSRTSKFW